jgi:hypothetical protein
MKYIAYWDQPMFPGTIPYPYATLKDMREGFEEYCTAVGVDECSGLVYGWSEEAWESAVEFQGVGCPFDYPWLQVSRGPRGGIKIEGC